MSTSGRENHDEATLFHPGQSCGVHFGGPCSSAKQAKIPRHYAGALSAAFWEQIKSIKDRSDQDSARFAGVLLQELEERVLGHIERASRHFVQSATNHETLQSKLDAAVAENRGLLALLEAMKEERNEASVKKLLDEALPNDRGLPNE